MKFSLPVLVLAISVGLTTIHAVPTLAQATTPYSGAVPIPPIIAQAEGARQVGLIGGLSAWTIPGQEAVFIIAPDGQSTIIGYVFGPDGTDIGAQISGSAPVDLGQILKAQADIEASSLLSTEAATPAPSSVAMLSKSDPAEGSSEPLRAELPALAIDTHLDDLTEQLDAARTREEFKAALEGWAENLVAQAKVIEANDGVAGTPSAPSNVPPAPTLASEAGPAPLPLAVADGAKTASSTSALSQAKQGSMSAEQLIEQVRTNSFWFEVGAYDAPTVYAFIDPDCPFCARAMLNLQDDVETGKLKLRVLLTPFLHEASIGYAGAILTTTDPENPAAVAFWKHELERAYGTSTLEPLADLSSIPSELVDGMQLNIDLMKAAGISGVPYFIYQTQDGVKTHFGVAQAGQFSDAMTDVLQRQ